MERLTLRDDDGRALLTPYGLRIYCSTQATADCICKLEEALQAQEPLLVKYTTSTIRCPDADEKRKVITDLVDGIPAVDAAPVVHARWKAILNPFWDAECSECGYKKKNGWEWRYCPACGARMSEG